MNFIINSKITFWRDWRRSCWYAIDYCQFFVSHLSHLIELGWHFSDNRPPTKSEVKDFFLLEISRHFENFSLFARFFSRTQHARIFMNFPAFHSIFLINSHSIYRVRSKGNYLVTLFFSKCVLSEKILTHRHRGISL
jgi:hypothetical protein